MINSLIFMINLEVGDIVMCTVERIVGTIVFVRIEGNGEGSIVFSEVAPGRIRNIRDYVVPKKKVVCKVLRIINGQIHLSLRRVTQKEEKELREQDKLEKSYKSILKSVLLEKADKIIESILQEQKLSDFFSEAKENSENLEKLVGKENAQKVLEILGSQREKSVVLKKSFVLTSNSSDGLSLIKKVLGDCKDVKIKYISAGRYSISSESDTIKNADKIISEVLDKISKDAKKNNMEFAVRDK